MTFLTDGGVMDHNENIGAPDFDDSVADFILGSQFQALWLDDYIIIDDEDLDGVAPEEISVLKTNDISPLSSSRGELKLRRIYRARWETQDKRRIKHNIPISPQVEPGTLYLFVVLMQGLMTSKKKHHWLRKIFDFASMLFRKYFQIADLHEYKTNGGRLTTKDIEKAKKKIPKDRGPKEPWDQIDEIPGRRNVPAVIFNETKKGKHFGFPSRKEELNMMPTKDAPPSYWIRLPEGISHFYDIFVDGNHERNDGWIWGTHLLYELVK